MNIEYLKSIRKYPCDCPKCSCPSSGGRRYTFRYIKNRCVYYDVPKCASSTIRRTLFGEDESCSMRFHPRYSPKGCFKFSFVRNPWDRMVSNWKSFTTQGMRIKQLESMGGRSELDFDQFVKFALVNKNHHWLPQSLYVPSQIDFLGRVESFDRDFGFVLDALRVESSIVKLNTSDRGSYVDYYTDSSRKLVEKMYWEDITRFGYKYGE